MSLFKQRQPRGFHHNYIYVDSKKERMAELENRARQELGLSSSASDHHERLKGQFLNATKYAKRYSERRQSGRLMLNFGVIVVLLVVLVALWRMLLTL